MPEADLETVELPPGEKVAINRMADKFHEAMKVTQPTPAQPVQSNVEPEIPDIPKTHKDWKALKAVKDRAIEEAKAAKAELEKLKAQKQTPSQQAQPANTAEPALDEENGDPALPPEIPPQSKARQAFERLKQIKDKAAKDYETTKAEFEKFKAGGSQTELENLRAQLQERENILASVAVEKMPEFRAHFAQRFQTVISEAAEAVGPEHAAKVSQVFGMAAGAEREKAFEALAGEVTDLQKIGLVASFQNWKRTEKAREAELAKAPQTLKAITGDNARREKEAELQAIRQRAALVGHITSQIEPELEGAEPEQANAIRANVKKFVDGGDAELFVSTMTAAAKWQRHEKAFRDQSDLIAKLESQVNELQASNPSLRSNGRTDTKPKLPPLDNSDIGPKFKRLMERGPVSRAV